MIVACAGRLDQFVRRVSELTLSKIQIQVGIEAKETMRVLRAQKDRKSPTVPVWSHIYTIVERSKNLNATGCRLIMSQDGRSCVEDDIWMAW